MQALLMAYKIYTIQIKQWSSDNIIYYDEILRMCLLIIKLTLLILLLVFFSSS